MKVDFYGHVRLYNNIKAQIDANIAAVIQSGNYVLGPMLKRFEGEFAAYSGSKFALAGWSEAMAADLVGTGVTVRLVLPGPIDTEIWDQPGNDAAVYDGPLVPPDEVAEGLIAAVASDRFEHYIPDLKAVVEMKTKDFDGFVAAMRSMGDHSDGDGVPS